MNSESGPILHALQDLRRSLGSTAALCDAIIFGGPSDATQAKAKLPPALALLGARVQLALEALEQEP
jgi:hypothetical protein